MPKLNGTIKRMACLREQRNMVRAVYERPKDLEYPTDDYIHDYFMSHEVFLDDKRFDNAKLSKEEQTRRSTRVVTLFRSCLEDKFIEPVTETYEDFDWSGISAYSVLSGTGTLSQKRIYTRDHGYHATSRGTDLLRPLGFLNIFIEKYGKLQIAVTSAAAVTLIGFLLKGVFSFICYFWPIIRACHS